MTGPEDKTTAPKAPKGFDAVDYPDVERGTTPTLYVCQTCHPVWDTFDADAAAAHGGTPEHTEGTERGAARGRP